MLLKFCLVKKFFKTNDDSCNFQKELKTWSSSEMMSVYWNTLHPELHMAVSFVDLGLRLSIISSEKPFLSIWSKVIILFALFHMYFVHGFYHLIISHLFVCCLPLPRMKAPRKQGTDLLICIPCT